MRKLLVLLALLSAFFSFSLVASAAPALAEVCHPTTVTPPVLHTSGSGGFITTHNHIYCDIPYKQINISDYAFVGDNPTGGHTVYGAVIQSPPYTSYGTDFDNGWSCGYFSGTHWYGHTVYWHVNLYDGSSWEGGPFTSSGNYGTCIY